MTYLLFFAGVSLTIISIILILFHPHSQQEEDQEQLQLLRRLEERIEDLNERERMPVVTESTSGSKGNGSSPSFNQHFEYNLNNGNQERQRQLIKIRGMLDDGHDRTEIAERLNLGHRELRLILKMNGWG